ncbi:MAG: hypothetical protein IT223_03775 [Crocinitomicaceae bacterium]|nr:hypothetical protein [Crocinitomicaceae bacterium]
MMNILFPLPNRIPTVLLGMLFSVATLLPPSKSAAQCQAYIMIDGMAASPTGLPLPIWLHEGQTISMNAAVSLISALEFTLNGTALEFSQALSITSLQTVPTGKVWKIESVIKLPMNGTVVSSAAYNTAGTHTFTVPVCTNYICIEAWGAGGGGGGGAGSTQNAGGGGGGGYGAGCYTVTPGSSISVVVGAGGTAGASGGGTGGNGGSSSVGSLITATGGNGATVTGGTGGASSAPINTTGGNGGNGGTGSCNAGGGGVGANGGNGGTPGCNTGGTGGTPGGGGGGGNVNGGTPYNGGKGGVGAVKITW